MEWPFEASSDARQPRPKLVLQCSNCQAAGRFDRALARAGSVLREVQADLAVLRSRAALVRARATLVNHARGAVKSIGGRLPRCETRYVAERAALHLPPELVPALSPILSAIAELRTAVARFDAGMTQGQPAEQA